MKRSYGINVIELILTKKQCYKVSHLTNIYIYIYMGSVQVIHGVTLGNVTPLDIF